MTHKATVKRAQAIASGRVATITCSGQSLACRRQAADRIRIHLVRLVPFRSNVCAANIHGSYIAGCVTTIAEMRVYDRPVGNQTYLSGDPGLLSYAESLRGLS